MTITNSTRPPIGIKNMSDRQWISLKQNNQLPHAFLITGLPGLGKQQLVSHYADLLLCQHATETGICHQCTDCQLRSANTHPDYVILEPLDESSIIKIDQIRSLQTFLRQTAQQGQYRIVCIDPADQLHPGAANSLLKILEEPGDKTVICLISSRPSQLLATIKSRCFSIHGYPPSLSEASQWLQIALREQSITISEEQCHDYLMQTGVAPLAALSLAMNETPLDWQAWLSDLATIVLQQQSPVQVAEKWQDFSLDDLLQAWLHACCTFTRYCQSGDRHIESNLTAWIPLTKLIAQTPLLAHLLQFYDQLMTARRQVRSFANPNERLLLETLLIHWYNLNVVNQSKSLV